MLYLEGIRDGRRLVAAARRAHEAGKPVVLIAAGASDAASRAARSHTGALASGPPRWAPPAGPGAWCEVVSPRQAVAAIQVLLPQVRPVVPASGSSPMAAAMGCWPPIWQRRAGLTVPSLRPATRRGGGEQVSPPPPARSIPSIMAGGGEQDFSSYGRVVDTLLASGEVDAVLLTGFFGGYSVKSDELGQRELAAAATWPTPAIDTSGHCWSSRCIIDAMPNDALRATRGPGLRRGRRRHPGAGPRRPLAETCQPGRCRCHRRPHLSPATTTGRRERCWPTPGCRSPTPGWCPRHEATGHDRADLPARRQSARAAPQIGRGWSGARHRRRRSRWRRRWQTCERGWRRRRSCVEEQAPLADGVELIIGCRHDPSFGLLLMVGFGGIYAEILQGYGDRARSGRCRGSGSNDPVCSAARRCCTERGTSAT